MKKLVNLKLNARGDMLHGAKMIAECVGSTLGPGGNLVALTNRDGEPYLTKDGVTVARHFEVDGETKTHVNIGAQLIRESAIKTNNSAGDGTTTSTILAYNFAKNLLKTNIKLVDIDKHRSEIFDICLSELKKLTRSITNEEKDIMSSIGTISANGNKEIGELISSIYAKIDKDGVVTIEKSQNDEITHEILDGLVIKKGFVSAHMVTDRVSGTAKAEKPLILLYEGVVQNFMDVAPIIGYASSKKKPLVIIAENFTPDALTHIAINISKGTTIIGVESPSFGELRREMLIDIQIATGGIVVSDSNGMKDKIKSITSNELFLKEDNQKMMKEILGEAEAIISNKLETVLSLSEKFNAQRNNRVVEIMSDIERRKKDGQNPYMVNKLEERVAKLQGKIARIYVGGQTSISRDEIYDRVVDANGAVKGALSDGIVAGGAYVNIQMYRALKKAYDAKKGLDIDSRIYRKLINVFTKTLIVPIMTILKNAGYNILERYIILKKLIDEPKILFDARRGEYVSSDIKSVISIVDSAQVVKEGFINSFEMGLHLYRAKHSLSTIYIQE